MVDSQCCCDCKVEVVVWAAALWQHPSAPPGNDRLCMQTPTSAGFHHIRRKCLAYDAGKPTAVHTRAATSTTSRLRTYHRLQAKGATLSLRLRRSTSKRM